jgi:hypothetical protein
MEEMRFTQLIFEKQRFTQQSSGKPLGKALEVYPLYNTKGEFLNPPLPSVGTELLP